MHLGTCKWWTLQFTAVFFIYDRYEFYPTKVLRECKNRRRPDFQKFQVVMFLTGQYGFSFLKHNYTCTWTLLDGRETLETQAHFRQPYNSVLVDFKIRHKKRGRFSTRCEALWVRGQINHSNLGLGHRYPLPPQVKSLLYGYRIIGQVRS